MTFFGPDLRNGLPIGLGSVAGFGIAPPRFSPASLFTGGVQGAWYDPSDSTTLFTDRAGTTPCGTPGQGSVVPVGLMLDKSQGLVLGSELVTNGDFSSGTTTGWTPQSAALSVVGGQLSVVPSTTFGYAYQTLTTVVGTTYKITFDYNQSTAAIARYFVGTAVGGDQLIALTTASGVGSVSRYFTATTTTTFIHFGAQNSSGLQALFDNISVRALAGNHAIAANDTTARPELRARVNLLTYSEQFDNAAWTKTNVTVTANAAVAPDGTTTADLLQPTATSGSGTIAAQAQSIAGAQGTYTATYRIKPSGFNWAIVAIRNIAGTKYIWQWFDLASPAVGSRQTNAFTLVSATIAPTANGYYVCTLTVTTDVADSGLSSFVGMSDANNNFTATASGSNGLLVWGAQLIATNEFPANTYQRISDANTYDAVGFPRYLVANGTSSAMSTPGNVNLSGTDKVTVFAGVRKTGAAGSTGFIFETSTAAESNNGAFRYGVESGGVEYFPGSRGTVFQQVSIDSAAYLPPVTNVLQASFDIGAPSVSARVNGTSVGTNTASQGTGNFGSYPLFIGSRNNASFFLNGNIYSIIVVGSAVSAGQISATEQWVAGKTGITI